MVHSKEEFEVRWEEVDTLPSHQQHRKLAGTIRIVPMDKGIGKATRFKYTVISADLIKTLGWKPGDCVTLYRSGNRFFKLAKVEAGLSTLKALGKGTNASIAIGGSSFARALFPNLNGGEFDAWVHEDYILFKPRRKEEV